MNSYVQACGTCHKCLSGGHSETCQYWKVLGAQEKAMNALFAEDTKSRVALDQRLAVECGSAEPQKAFSSGAKRSGSKPEWSLMPRKALREVLRRFEVGAKKYSRHNWKRAMESEDKEFITQFHSHADEHWGNFLDLIDRPTGATIEDDDLVANLAACVWGYLALLEYVLESETLVRQAFTQYPEGHTKRLKTIE